MTGTLGSFSLVDLFQLLAGAGRSGRLAVAHPLGLARVYFERGRAVHATFVQREGEAAVFALFEDATGTFEFTSGLPAPAYSIEVPTETLVLEALRRLDERNRGTPRPDRELSREAVPYAVDEGPEGLPYSDDERRLLAAVNGVRSIAKIASVLALDVSHTQRMVERLVDVGALRLRTRRPRTAQLVVRLARTGIPSGVIGVDEGIVHNWERVLGHDVESVAVRRPSGSAFAAPVSIVVGGGPFLFASADTLLRFDLAVDDTVLAKPYGG